VTSTILTSIVSRPSWPRLRGLEARGTTKLSKMVLVIALPQLVSVWFQVLLTTLIGVLFIVQSPYFSTIGCRVVLSLGGWSPLLRTEFHELRATLER
jgi:hypothetical protein